MTSKNKQYWLGSAFFTVFDRLAVQVFGMGTVMLLLRHFADRPETYGVWVLYLMIGAFIEVSRNGLIQSALIKFINGASPEDYAKVATASFTLNLIFTGMVCLFLFLGSGWLGQLIKAPGLDKMLHVYILTTIALAPFIQFNFLQQANLQFRGIFTANIVRQGLFFAFIAGSLSLGKRLELMEMAWVQFALAVVASCISWYYARPYIQLSKKINREWTGRMFRFGIFTFGTNLSTMIYKTIDRIMLGIMMPTQAAAMQAVAVFDPAMRITNVMEIPIQSMASMSYPQSAKRMSEEGVVAVKKLYEKSVGVVLALLLPLCLVVLLFPNFFIVILAGKSEAFAGAAAILQITILYTLFVPYGRQFGIVMDTIGKPRISFVFVLTSAIANIVSNYFFIRAFGVIGAAYGTLLTLTIRFVIQQYILYRILDIRTLRPLQYSWEYTVKAVRMAFQVISHPSTLAKWRK